MDEKKMIELWDRSCGNIYVYADLVSEYEREQCAKICDGHWEKDGAAYYCAKTIRAREQE